MNYSDPVSYSRDEIIRRGIDRTILELAFGGIKYNGSRKSLAMELDRVILDACNSINLISGDVIDIPVSKCKKLVGNNHIYYVPPEVRRNRDIREVLSLRTAITTPNSGTGFYVSGTSPIVDALSTMSGALSKTYTDGITQVELIDTNTIAIKASTMVLSTNDTFAVDLFNRERLNHLKKGSYSKFYTIVLSYVKSVIYNNRIAIKKAAIFGGHEISDIDSEIDGYSDESGKFDEFIEEGQVGKMLFFSDETKSQNIYQQYIKF